MPYDTEKDFAPVSIVGQVPDAAGDAIRRCRSTTFQGFVDYARKNPGKINVSSCGQRHAAARHDGAADGQGAKCQVTNVPYRGAAPALADLVAGQVQAKLDNYTHLGAVHRRPASSTLLAVTSTEAPEAVSRRADAMAEQRAGLRGLSLDGQSLRRPPRPTRWSPSWPTAIQRFVAQPETQARFDKDGIEPVGNGPDEFRAQIASEIAQWRELAKTTKITVD